MLAVRPIKTRRQMFLLRQNLKNEICERKINRNDMLVVQINERRIKRVKVNHDIAGRQ